jgi:hypothetical protein
LLALQEFAAVSGVVVPLLGQSTELSLYPLHCLFLSLVVSHFINAQDIALMPEEITVPVVEFPPKVVVNWPERLPTVLAIVAVAVLHIKSVVGVTHEVFIAC